VLYVLSFGRWIACAETGLTTSKGQTVPYAGITKIEKERWKTKGIVIVRYKNKDQREGRIVLDDWKYEAQATKNILLEIEAQLKPEQIVGGEPDRRPEPPTPGPEIGVAPPPPQG
jgi:hypothetical protein